MSRLRARAAAPARVRIQLPALTQCPARLEISGMAMRFLVRPLPNCRRSKLPGFRLSRQLSRQPSRQRIRRNAIMVAGPQGSPLRLLQRRFPRRAILQRTRPQQTILHRTILLRAGCLKTGGAVVLRRVKTESSLERRSEVRLKEATQTGTGETPVATRARPHEPFPSATSSSTYRPSR